MAVQEYLRSTVSHLETSRWNKPLNSNADPRIAPAENFLFAWLTFGICLFIMGPDLHVSSITDNFISAGIVMTVEYLNHYLFEKVIYRHFKWQCLRYFALFIHSQSFHLCNTISAIFYAIENTLPRHLMILIVLGKTLTEKAFHNSEPYTSLTRSHIRAWRFPIFRTSAVWHLKIMYSFVVVFSFGCSRHPIQNLHYRFKLFQ